MITTILSDFSRVILNPKELNYGGQLNSLYAQLQSSNKRYDFFEYYSFDEEVLELYRSIQNKVSLYIFTSGSIQNDPAVRKVIDPIFKDIFTARDLGLDKNNAEVYKMVLKQIGVTPQEVVFIDDMEINIEAAKKSGLHTIQFKDAAQLKEELLKFV